MGFCILNNSFCSVVNVWKYRARISQQIFVFIWRNWKFIGDWWWKNCFLIESELISQCNVASILPSIFVMNVDQLISVFFFVQINLIRVHRGTLRNWSQKKIVLHSDQNQKHPHHDRFYLFHLRLKIATVLLCISSLTLVHFMWTIFAFNENKIDFPFQFSGSFIDNETAFFPLLLLLLLALIIQSLFLSLISSDLISFFAIQI